MDQILAIKTDSGPSLKAYAMAGITVLFVASLVQSTGSRGMTATEKGTYHSPPSSSGGGESCPHVYVWDGSRYELQAEPFGIAWGKALELTTLHLLPAARPEHGVVRLRVINEREETHYVNSVQLHAIDLGESLGAVLDGEGRAWPLSHPIAPAKGHDDSGRDILTQVASADGHMWECDPSSLTPDSGYEDILEVTFKRLDNASVGSLVLTGINTGLSMAFYGQLCRMMGDRTALLAHAVETDPELISRLHDYLRDASLEALVWNGHDWESVGAFQPEATAVTFTRALRIRVPEGAGETVRVRLRSMADVWKIDAISVDWGDAEPLKMTPLEMLTATGPMGEDLQGAIGTDDGRYAILLPPDRIDLTFAAAGPEAGARVSYVVAGRGYLHEWEPRESGEEPATVAALVPEGQRVAFVKELMKHREFFMQPAYEAWREARTR